MAERDELICHYFHGGYTQTEITCILHTRHDIICSTRTVQRVLQRFHLQRNNPNDDLCNMCLRCLQVELDGSGNNLGCRSMHRRLMTRYGLHVPRDFVLEGQRLLDPEGVERRRRHRLTRRLYCSLGPNYAIHVDQYDKLLPYGFGIHGAMDGFSRRILWLRVAPTNRDPRVVASYFMDLVDEINGVPRCIQMDRGTENTTIADIQTAFHDVYADRQGTPCVIYSASPHNQRIERFWRTLFEMMVHYWRNGFRELVHDGVLDCTSPIHLECLRFCCMQLLQLELSEIHVEWNQHNTRASPQRDAFPGKPDLMYFIPQIYATQDFKLAVPREEITAIKEEFTTPPSVHGCDMEFEAVCRDLLHAHNRTLPSSFEEAIQLFEWLVQQVVVP